MDRIVEHDELDEALRRCHSTWNAAQAHGLLCSRLAVRGSAAAADWLDQVLKDSDADTPLRSECAALLLTLWKTSFRQLDERLSAFSPLLPDDTSPPPARADALAHWCEGFLHGLVSGPHPENLKTRLAGEPIGDIIKDMLEITRATVDSHVDDEDIERAYAELVEYVRVAAQLTYEELAGFRPPDTPAPPADSTDVIH